MQLRSKSILENTVREVVFGLEDSLVSTMGAVTGIAAGTDNKAIVILSGLVILAVEATSMGAGSYLSNKTAGLVETGGKKGGLVLFNSIKAGLIMLFFYILGGLIPLLPYFFISIKNAIPFSIFLTVAALIGVGFWTGRVTKRSGWGAAIEMAVVSLGAAGIGYGIGRLVSFIFHIDS